MSPQPPRGPHCHRSAGGPETPGGAAVRGGMGSIGGLWGGYRMPGEAGGSMGSIGGL